METAHKSAPKTIEGMGSQRSLRQTAPLTRFPISLISISFPFLRPDRSPPEFSGGWQKTFTRPDPPPGDPKKQTR